MMNAKQIVILAGNGALGVGLLVLFGFGKIDWQHLAGGLALLGFPSLASALGSDDKKDGDK